MRILITEDESAIREAEVAYLKRAGFTTLEAADGKTALALFRDHDVDLVILDCNLPEIDGITVCREIRKTSTVPIVVVTAKDGDSDEIEGLEAGADDYIKKPFNPNVLVARIERLLRRRGHSRVVRGSLVIDPDTMVVTKEYRPIYLTITQFNLLLTLATQPGVVLTRDQLIRQVYDDPGAHDVYDRTIDAHIKSLRKCIEDDPAHPIYIQTVIGRGYRFSRGEK